MQSSKQLRSKRSQEQSKKPKLHRQQLPHSLPRRSAYQQRCLLRASRKWKLCSALLLPSSREAAKLAAQQVIAHCWQATALQILARQRLVAVEV